jgi:hypothetical protein
MRPQLGLNEARVTDSTQPKRLPTVIVVMVTQRTSRTPPAGTTAIQFSPLKVSVLFQFYFSSISVLFHVTSFAVL